MKSRSALVLIDLQVAAFEGKLLPRVYRAEELLSNAGFLIAK